MRSAIYLLPLLFAGLVVAQQASSAEELVEKLGHEDYEVREQATRQLVELGEKAVPALEEALTSDDIEVRLRAGRAMRAIRNAGRQLEREPMQPEPGERPAPGGKSTSSGVQVEVQDGQVKVTVRETVDGELKERTYSGKSLEELRKKHPELRKHLGSLRFRFGQAQDPFDMDKFWEGWNDDFLKNMREDSQREMERIKRLMQRWGEQRRELMENLRQPRAQAPAHVLGVRVTAPSRVLDAQLDLRGKGLVIDAVEKGSRGDRLGLERFDILLKLNGADLRSARDVGRVLARHKESDPITATVVRRGQVMDLRPAR